MIRSNWRTRPFTGFDAIIDAVSCRAIGDRWAKQFRGQGKCTEVPSWDRRDHANLDEVKRAWQTVGSDGNVHPRMGETIRDRLNFRQQSQRPPTRGGTLTWEVKGFFFLTTSDWARLADVSEVRH